MVLYGSAVTGLIYSLWGKLSELHPFNWVAVGIFVALSTFFTATYVPWWIKERQIRNTTVGQEDPKGFAHDEHQPYSKSWDRNQAFLLQQAACLWVGIEPINPTPLGTKPYPVQDRLITASDEGILETREGNPDEPWSRRVTRKALIAYCDDTEQRPDFLFREMGKTFLKYYPFSGRGNAEFNNINGWSHAGNQHTVEFISPIPKDKQVFYVSEEIQADIELTRRSEKEVRFNVNNSEEPIKITFD